MTENKNFKSQIFTFWGKSPESKEETIRYLLSINNFKSFDDWKNIIEVFLSIDNYFLEKHPDKILDIIHRAQDDFSEPDVTNFLIFYLKEESRIDLDFSNFFYALNQQHKKQNEDARKTFPKEDLNEICNRRLERYVTDGERNVIAAFNHLYSCWDFVDDENKVHITKEALELMRVYIEKESEQYLRFIVRNMFISTQPQFGYYHFVLEPFTKQIFNGWDNFENYLRETKSRKNVNMDVIDCLIKFYDFYKKRNYESVPIEKNKLKEFKFCSKQIEEILNKN